MYTLPSIYERSIKWRKTINEMARYISGGNFPGGNFPGGSLMGGNFPGGNFPRTIKSVYYCSETISYLWPKIWNLQPQDIKDSDQKLNFGNLKTHIGLESPDRFYLIRGPLQISLKIWANCSLWENFMFQFIFLVFREFFD